MKRILKTVLIVSIIVCIISVIGTIASKIEYNMRMEETGIKVEFGQYDSFYGDLNSLIAMDKQIKAFYVFDALSAAAILGSAIGLRVVTNKEIEDTE